jgi:hypothetical protein
MHGMLVSSMTVSADKGLNDAAKRASWWNLRPVACLLVNFELETVVSPSQAELPALYKGNDVFMFSSR